MMNSPRILTFNFHEPYLCMMAETGLDFDIGLYERGPFARAWQHVFRPAPENLHFVGEQTWRQRLKQGYYDVVIAQNENNAVDAADSDAGRLLICHNRRTYLHTTINDDAGDGLSKYAEMLGELQNFYDFVYISDSKRDDYGLPGRVIRPGFNVDNWGGYRGDTACAIRVGNTMRQRDLMFDVDFQEACCEGLPNRVVGTNPLIPGSVSTTSFDDLLEIFRSHRCLLHVSREAYEDGYNLAMLEAMACGMPVVSLANPTSPITNGVNGYADYDHKVLRQYLQTLLDDPDGARALGAKGRELVADEFPLSTFVTQWREAILEAADKKPVKRSAPMTEKKKSRVGVPFLLSYVACPHTTGRYIREAIRKDHTVLSCGRQIPDTLLIQWGFSYPIPDYPKHDFALRAHAEVQEIEDGIPSEFKPALLLWVDSGQDAIEPGFAALDLPKVAWFIDTHVSSVHRIEIARHFDFVYLAQLAQVQAFLDAGISQARWLPLGCAPELHDVPSGERHYDIAFVGSMSSASGDHRRHFIERVREAFPNHFITQCWPHEMAEAYAHAKIVVNMCLNADVNMRVFEAMASGALLITDDAIGLSELFENGRDLVVYDDEDDALSLIQRYLDDDAAREAIARQGQQRVLQEHTYASRIQTMLRDVEKTTGPLAIPLPHHGVKNAEGYYQHPRRELLQGIPVGAKRVLDVGCGAGALGKVLKEERGVEEVCGVEFIEEAYLRAVDVLDRVYLGNIEEMTLPFEDGHFDCIICADVLEHLVEPEAVLRKLDRVLAPHGVIVISIPNARNFEVLHMLGQGCWTYYEQGIMDATHLRFYTRIDFIKMIESAGMKAANVTSINSRPASALPLNEDGSLTIGNFTFHNVSKAEHEEFLTYQHLGIACKASWDALDTANRAMDEGEYEMALGIALDAVGVDEVEQLHIVARAYGRLGSLKEAASAYELALKKSDAPLIVGDYGILLLAMNAPHRAKPLLVQAMAADASLDRVDAALGLIAMQEGALDDAFTHFQRAMLNNFDHKGLFASFLSVARALGRMEEALPVLTAYIEFYPGNLDLKVQFAQALAELGQDAEAREQLDMVVLFDPANEAALRLLSTLDSNTPDA